MASEVIWQPQAVLQLEEALDQCEAMFGQQVTLDFYDKVKHYDLLLATNSRMGPCEPLLGDLPQELRSIVIHSHYKLIYHIDDNQNINIIDLWDTRGEPDKLKQNLLRHL